MDNTPWQRRLRRAGLNQKQLSRLVDLTEQNCSKALRGELQGGTPRYLINFIRVWERLPLDARDEVLALAEQHEDETSAAFRLGAAES